MSDPKQIEANAVFITQDSLHNLNVSTQRTTQTPSISPSRTQINLENELMPLPQFNRQISGLNDEQLLVQGYELTYMSNVNQTFSMSPTTEKHKCLVRIGSLETKSFLPSAAKSKYPQEIFCLKCKKEGVTKTEKVIGQGSWAVSLALVCGGCWPCACFPFCLSYCKDVEHSCSVCGSKVGRRKFLFD